MKNSKYDLVLIRHAQSLFNEATLKASRQLGIEHKSWDQLIKNEQFNKLVTYNRLYMDPPLSQTGLMQCENYRKECEKINPDVILVSPYKRALETCHQLFKNSKAPVFVEPILSEVFRFACDVPEELQNVRKKYPKFEFNKVSTHNNEWFLLNLVPDIQNKIRQELTSQVHEQNRIKLLQMLENKYVKEDPKMLRERAAGIKKMLRCYKQKYEKIVVVAHYYIIEFLKSTGFDEQNDLIQYSGIMNCHPYYQSLHKLEQIV